MAINEKTFTVVNNSLIQLTTTEAAFRTGVDGRSYSGQR